MALVPNEGHGDSVLQTGKNIRHFFSFSRHHFFQPSTALALSASLASLAGPKSWWLRSFNAARAARATVDSGSSSSSISLAQCLRSSRMAQARAAARRISASSSDSFSPSVAMVIRARRSARASRAFSLPWPSSQAIAWASTSV